jgi:hypothetical protein
MSLSPRYINRDTAAALLTGHGFNRLDIECVLDLAGPAKRTGHGEMWSAELLERIAARAWWLDRQALKAQIVSEIPAAA